MGFFDGLFRKSEAQVADGILSDIVTGIGQRGYDKGAGFTVSTSLKIAPEATSALYFDNWAGRKAVDIIPDDMTREWRTWEHDKAEEIYEAERVLKLQKAVNLALKEERRTGGALILMKVRNADLAKELPDNAIVEALEVFNADEVTAESWDENTASVLYGTPLTYLLKTPEYSSKPFHRSHFLIFPGADSTRDRRKNNNGFGESILQPIKDACYGAEATRAALVHLVQEANIDVIKMGNVANRLSTIEGQRNFRAALELMNSTKSIFRALLIDKEDTYDRKNVSFAGLTDIQQQQIQLIAAGCDIPLVRFMGSSPTGLGSNGAQETRAYYDSVRARQTTHLSAILRPLDDRMLAALGVPRADVSYEWKPLWTLNEVEAAKAALDMAKVDQIYAGTGLFEAAQMASVIKQRLVAAGTYPTADIDLDTGDDTPDVSYSELPEDPPDDNTGAA